MSVARERKEWRQADSRVLASLDFFGVRHFIYGGDPEWVRRRWFMVMVLAIGAVWAIGAIIVHALGHISEAFAKAIVDNYFTLIMATVPTYVLGAAWDAKNKMNASASVSEESTVTETVKKEVVPVAPTSEE